MVSIARMRPEPNPTVTTLTESFRAHRLLPSKNREEYNKRPHTDRPFMPNSGRIGLYHLAAKKEEDDIWIREGGKKNDLSDRLKKSHFKAASRLKEDRFRNKFYFSHLYTALDQPDFQKFLGIMAETSLKPNPVPRGKLDELGELMTWIYGRKSTNTEPVIRKQNPDLNNLRVVIAKPAALSLLRAGYSLAAFFEQ
ncbi:MAG: hypothetical protein COX52_09270 [Syntrophobacterales bacterium CG23_combo_of_CG06-09_8_20_14_all_48_27]|nr:MAG: hypothetical protein COX52_09270 [Syntrophobacterales bacterium CG23_combo_of_CG06-09_8_20_14_all_48_27]